MFRSSAAYPIHCRPFCERTWNHSNDGPSVGAFGCSRVVRMSTPSVGSGRGRSVKAWKSAASRAPGSVTAAAVMALSIGGSRTPSCRPELRVAEHRRRSVRVLAEQEHQPGMPRSQLRAILHRRPLPKSCDQHHTFVAATPSRHVERFPHPRRNRWPLHQGPPLPDRLGQPSRAPSTTRFATAQRVAAARFATPIFV